VVDLENLRDPVGAETFGDVPSDLGLKVFWQAGPPYSLPVGLGSRHARLGALADLLRLDLGQAREQRQQNIAHQLVVRGQVYEWNPIP
jgi:hypothetical protein